MRDYGDWEARTKQAMAVYMVRSTSASACDKTAESIQRHTCDVWMVWLVCIAGLLMPLLVCCQLVALAERAHA